MAPTPSTIPTSFVPKQPVRTGQQFAKSGGNTFLALALAIFFIALLASGGVFAYERYLMSVRDAKAAAVAEAQKSINADAVESFVRMRDRFDAAHTLLDSHIAATGFFRLLESVTLQSVRFDSLSLEVIDEDRSAVLRMEGSAQTFNALAAQSSTLAGEKRIKRAIFSGIAEKDDGTIAFVLDAELDPRLLEFTTEDLPTAPPAPLPEPEGSTLPEEGIPTDDVMGDIVPEEPASASVEPVPAAPAEPAPPLP